MHECRYVAAGVLLVLGMAPSADIGDECAVFQPAHGTASDIAGRYNDHPANGGGHPGKAVRRRTGNA